MSSLVAILILSIFVDGVRDPPPMLKFYHVFLTWSSGAFGIVVGLVRLGAKQKAIQREMVPRGDLCRRLLRSCIGGLVVTPIVDR